MKCHVRGSQGTLAKPSCDQAISHPTEWWERAGCDKLSMLQGWWCSRRLAGRPRLSPSCSLSWTVLIVSLSSQFSPVSQSLFQFPRLLCMFCVCVCVCVCMCVHVFCVWGFLLVLWMSSLLPWDFTSLGPCCTLPHDSIGWAVISPQEWSSPEQDHHHHSCHHCSGN